MVSGDSIVAMARAPSVIVGRAVATYGCPSGDGFGLQAVMVRGRRGIRSMIAW
jgi:hypothetical protein